VLAPPSSFLTSVKPLVASWLIAGISDVGYEFAQREGNREQAIRSIGRCLALQRAQMSHSRPHCEKFNFLPINKTPNSPADKKERTVCPQLSAIVANVSTKKMCSRRI
jgi:hypothetical protein